LLADAKFSRNLDALRDRYDIVLLDSRGMGESNPSNCVFYPAQSPQLYFRQLFPDMLVKSCRARVSAYSDLNQYRTVNAVDDLDDARAALGYPKLVLNGGSYGTYFSLVYLRRHPKYVESAVLSGVYAPHFQPVPGAPDGAQKALQDLVAKCRQDSACRKHFPQFASHFASVIERFKRGPLSVPLKVGSRFVNVPLYAEVLVDRVRQALYDPDNAATIPFVFERAYRSDYKPLGDLVNGMTLALARALDYGAFLSYTCADEVPFIKESAIREVAARSFVSDLRVRAQQHACALWHVRPMPAAFDAVVRSNVPVLMIIGSDDPATPSKYSEQELPYLTHGFALVVSGAGHINEVPCTDSAMVAFVRSGGERPKMRCAASFRLPPFELK
jgi:pimeloyl-ACP methyl ester carboxylesterase